MKKDVVTFLLVLLCVFAMPKVAMAAATSGSCGESATWSYNNGTLTIRGTGVVESNPWMENYKDSITTLVVQEGITSLDGRTLFTSGAFTGCDSLVSVSLPQSLTSIGMYAFKGCDSLKSITIPKNVVTCDGYCFYESALETVTFEDGATVVPGFMFERCQKLKTVHLPQTIKRIELSAFEDCDALTSFTSPYYLEEIEAYAFKSCSNLKKITIYQNVKTIDMYAFKNIETLTICGKKNSEAHKFANEQGYTFQTCKIPALKGISYTKGNLKYQVITDYINGKGTVMVTGMKKNASSVTIPKMVKLESYNYKVVKINSNAFKGKSKLNKITIQSIYLTSVGKNAIKGINKNATIKVPKSKYSAYRKLFKSSTGYKKTMKIKK